MNEVLHANIFFVIASVATVIFCILVAIALYQVIKILRAVRRITDRIEMGSEQIAEDVAALRSAVRDGGLWSRVLSSLFGLFTQAAPKRRRGRSKS